MFDFETNTAVKDINIVPEQFRPLFAEDPAEKGVFKIAADDPKVKGSVEAIIGLNKALRAERAATKDLKGKVVDLTPLADYGKSPEEIAASVKAKLEEMQAQVAAGKGAKLDLDKIKQDIAAGHAKTVEAKEAQIKGLTGQLEAVLIDNALRSAIGDQAVDADLIMPFAKNYMRTIQEDGKIRAVVVDSEGSQRYSSTTSQPMTVAELVADMKRNPKYAPLFKSDAKRGSGADPGVSQMKIVTQVGSGGSAIDKIQRGLASRSR